MRSNWIPTLILASGAALTLGAAQQRALPLEKPLGGVVPTEINGYISQDLTVSDSEAEVVGFSNYLFRVYETPALEPGTPGDPGVEGEVPDLPWFSLYVGFYESQAQGRTIHSPKNCLPGAGWEAISSEPLDIEINGRTERVNRYLLQNGNERTLALYWYQGRGRIAHNEYRVKLNLLRDATFRRRSDEALVRIIVPVQSGNEDAATRLAVTVAQRIMPSLDGALPR